MCAPSIELPLGWAPRVVNSYQRPCCTHTIHSPLVRGISCEVQAWWRVEREKEMRMTPNYWLHLLCGHWAGGAGLGGFSEEGRGLSFSLIRGSDIEGMSKEWWDPFSFNYGPLHFSQRCTIAPLRGNQWGDKLMWTATRFICCVVVCMPGCQSKRVCVCVCG